MDASERNDTSFLLKAHYHMSNICSDMWYMKCTADHWQRKILKVQRTTYLRFCIVKIHSYEEP